MLLDSRQIAEAFSLRQELCDASIATTQSPLAQASRLAPSQSPSPCQRSPPGLLVEEREEETSIAHPGSGNRLFILRILPCQNPSMQRAPDQKAHLAILHER